MDWANIVTAIVAVLSVLGAAIRGFVAVIRRLDRGEEARRQDRRELLQRLDRLEEKVDQDIAGGDSLRHTVGAIEKRLRTVETDVATLKGARHA